MSDEPQLLLQSSFSEGEIADAVERLAREQRAFTSGTIVADLAWWAALRQRAIDAIDAEHKANPHHVGLKLTRLHDLFAKEIPVTFETLVADLSDHGAVRVGDVIKRAAHRPTLPPQLQMAGEVIRRALTVRPFDPPSRHELAPDALSQQALRYFIETGDAVEISEGVVLSREAFQKMRAAAIAFIRRHGPAAAGELRQALGSSRRVIVPFLERLDRDGATRRQGDKRSLTP